MNIVKNLNPFHNHNHNLNHNLNHKVLAYNLLNSVIIYKAKN